MDPTERLRIWQKYLRVSTRFREFLFFSVLLEIGASILTLLTSPSWILIVFICCILVDLYLLKINRKTTELQRERIAFWTSELTKENKDGVQGIQ